MIFCIKIKWPTGTTIPNKYLEGHFLSVYVDIVFILVIDK